MSDFRFFSTHRPWEDWFGMLLGMLIVASSWLPLQSSHEVMDSELSIMILNTFVVGMLAHGQVGHLAGRRVAAGEGRGDRRLVGFRFLGDHLERFDVRLLRIGNACL